jgi:hypothetical protein
MNLAELAPKKKEKKHARDRYLPLLLPRRYSAAALRQHPTPPHGIIIAHTRIAAYEWRRIFARQIIIFLPLPSLSLSGSAGSGGEEESGGGAKKGTGYQDTYQKLKRIPRHRGEWIHTVRYAD